MKFRKNAFVFSVVYVIATILADAAHSQIPGVMRTDLQQQPLSIPGREVVQSRIDIKPGITAPRHSHPGEEVIYILKGMLEYQLDGQPAKIYKPGDVLFIPAGVIHSAKNIGKGNGAELATYIVEKGKPILVLAAPIKTR
jgi:quercetin dioxygenase-like cupin family protein